MPIGTIIACVAVGWFISKREIDEDFLDFKLKGVWLFFAKYVTPILVALILFFGIFSFDGGFHFANDWRMILTAVMVTLILALTNLIALQYKKKRNKTHLVGDIKLPTEVTSDNTSSTQNEENSPKFIEDENHVDTKSADK